MRILHILNHTAKANGHVCAMTDIACVQASRGHEVYICSGGGDFDDLYHKYGITHIKINQNRTIRNLIYAEYLIINMLRKNRPDIVHAHMMTGAVLVGALRPFMSFRLVTTVHNEFQRSAILMGVGERVIAVSRAVENSMKARGIATSKLRTVVNGTINAARFPMPPPAPLKLQHPSITFVGGLHPRKGVDDLIKAFGQILKSHPQAHLYLVGDGPCRRSYEQMAAEVGKHSITFCGHAEDSRIYLLDTDIFVLASHAEPAGLVLSEARAVGCAIVGTSVGGTPELLEQGAAGLLVPPKRPDLLADAISRLISDEGYLTEMKKRSRANTEWLTVERVTDETERVYRELL
jgi:glycosyltransferase involved in cell wall biosynthesis